MSESTVYVNGRPVVIPDHTYLRGPGPRVVVRFVGPVGSSWARRLAAMGATVEFWCPPYGACVTLTGDADEHLAASEIIAGYVPYDEVSCDRALDATTELDWLDVICFSSADRPGVVKALRSLGAPILDESHSKIRIAWSGDPAPIREVIGVKVVERPRLPTTSATGLATDLGYGLPDGTWRADLDGTGEVIAIADTGLDTGDVATITPDLSGRIRALTSWPINPSWAPYVTNPGHDDGPADLGSGHGTYVAGLAAGSGARSGGRRRGVAPGARLVVQAIEQWVSVAPGHPEIGASRYTLAGRPTDLRELLTQGYRSGARIHVLAWGSAAGGTYDNDSYEVDLYLREHREAIVLVAAGNSGSDRNADRVIDGGSLDSPATAKNAMTIGATEGSDPNGFPVTWSRLQAEGRVFANAADLTDPVYGQPERMALLSSAGPTSDGRIKPDLSAPGTCLVGPRVMHASGRGWGLADPVPSYIVDGGTSAAVAVAGGATALLRQAWRAESRRRPAGVSLKALAILGAAVVLSRDGARPEDRRVAGYGRLDLDGALPHPTDGSAVQILANATVAAGVRTGQTRRHRVMLPGPGRIRAVLAWYDLPGERLINDLDLTLTGPGVPAPVWGNHQTGSPMTPGTPDRTNTVEVVDVSGLAGGTWELAVTGANVPQGPQPYALVVRTWT
ncbi:MAG: S8 family serine peptidase [Propionibacteriaceae bacterium]